MYNYVCTYIKTPTQAHFQYDNYNYVTGLVAINVVTAGCYMVTIITVVIGI